MALLQTMNLMKSFDKGFLATKNVSLSVAPMQITSIIGPNGAGKTTLLNLLTGALSPDSGQILYKEKNITKSDITKRVQMGICRSFQITNIFPRLTVRQNIEIPLISLQKKCLCFFSKHCLDRELQGEVDQVLADIKLEDQAELEASFLSHGDKRLLEIGIALSVKPELVFLDEPTQGMNKVEKQSIMEHIKGFAQRGLATFVVVEHDMDVVFSISDRIVVLHSGAIIAEGAPGEIRNNQTVRDVYLGDECEDS